MINIQLKNEPSSENKKTPEISLQQKIKIQKNAEDAKRILLDILELMGKAYTTALKKANELEGDLSNLSRFCSDKDFASRYLDTARDFINQLEVVNAYDDLQYDCRGEVVARYIDILERRESKKSAEVSSPVPTIQKTKKAAEEGLPPMPSFPEPAIIEPRMENPIISLRQQETALDKLLSSQTNDLALQIQTFIMKRELKNNSLDALLQGGLKKKTQQAIVAILDKIDQQEDMTYEYLLNKCYETGALDSFKKLFLYQKGYPLSLGFLESMIRWMATEEDKELRSHHIEICNFMLEASESYRQFISLSSHRIGSSRFPVEGYPHTTTLLAITLQYKNLPFFTMLLDHGYNSNEYSIVYNGYGISAIKASIVTCGDAPAYIVELLQHGAVIDQPSALVLEGTNYK